MDFTDKRVLITGSSRGIGFGIAEAFVEAGARVAINGKSPESVSTAMEKLGNSDHLIAAPADILTLLQRLQNELGMSYLFITPDLATVKAISDEIVVMLQGRVVEHGLRDEILTPPHHAYTELLLA